MPDLIGMERFLIKDLFTLKAEHQEVFLQGWVRSRRDSKGGFSFIELSDGSSIRTIQIVADNTLSNYHSDILKASTGSSIGVKGKLIPSTGKGQASEIQATEFILYNAPDESYPLQKKRHSFEFLREIAHLRPRTNTIGAVARLRSGLSFAVHKFFHERSFQHIHTPIISISDCEGAGQLFYVTNLDPYRKITDKQPTHADDFFGRPAYLTVSGQLQAEAYALALGNVYVFGPTFRAEDSHTSRHLAEFWMIEPEMAFCDLDDDAAMAEEFLKYILNIALNDHPDDMEFFNKFVDKNCMARIEEILKNSFERITYSEAMKLLKASGEKFEFEPAWGRDLQSEHERYLAEKKFNRPVIVTDYPTEIKPFYMKLNADEKTVRAMDVLVPGVGEIIGGSQREDDYDLLKTRMTAHGLSLEEYAWYLDLRRYGGVPHAGFGLGFERLLQFITGLENIRDVIPFPRAPGQARF